MLPHRVLEYKVKRAVDNGFAKDPQQLATHLGHLDEYRTINSILLDNYPDYYEEYAGQYLREPPLLTIEHLIAMAKEMGKERFDEFECYSHPCACMGPQDGDPLCPCQMKYELFTRKQEVLQYMYLEERGGI